MNRKEFSEQVKMYQKQMYITAFSILHNEKDAEDAVCSAILKGFEHLDQLTNSKKFKAWMLTIVKNEALKLQSKRLDLPGDDKVEKLLEPTTDHYNELWDIVKRLPESYRLVVVLFYYNDLSIKDISIILDIPVGTVKSRLNRGRDMLREALEGRGRQDEGI